MDGVIRGQSITEEAHYQLDGVLTDPSLPRITIRDPLGVAQVTDATPTRLSTGIYQYTYAVAIDALTGIWSAEWDGTISGQPLTSTVYFQVLPLGAIVTPPSSTYTYVLGTPVGVVRYLTDDRDMSAVDLSLPLEQRSAIFTDEEVQTLLDLTGQDPLLAAAMGLTTIAGNRSLLVQSRRIGKADIDYGPVRRDLLAQAEALRTQAREIPADGYAEQVWDDFRLRQITTNIQLRENAG